jgi:hypothetical protein
VGLQVFRGREAMPGYRVALDIADTAFVLAFGLCAAALLASHGYAALALAYLAAEELPPTSGAVPYDVPGVEMTHVGDLCSFDAFLSKYKLADPALGQLATVVRGADTSRLDLTPQSSGLYAMSLGLSQVFSDDHEMLGHGLVMYDALYAWCKSCQARRTPGHHK